MSSSFSHKMITPGQCGGTSGTCSMFHLNFPILYDRTLTKGSLVNKIRSGVKFPVCLESVAQAAWRAGFLYREDWVRSALLTRC